MKKIIRTLKEMIKTISKIFTLLLMFQIISFYSSAQTTYIRDGANNQKEIFDQNGNVMLSGNLIQKNITVDNPQSRGNSWEAIGPIGADIDEISICPDNSSILFAAAGNTYISNDGGANWVIIETLASISTDINCICALPEGKVIAGSDYLSGAYAKSYDNGITWTKRDLPPNSTAGQLCRVKEIVYDKTNPNIVFLGTTAASGNTKSEVLYKSTDGGETFEIIPNEIIDPETSIISICIDPTNSNVIFAVAAGSFVSSTVIVSTDGGDSWNNCSSGLPIQYPINAVVTYDGVTYIGGGHLYNSQNFGLYKSINTGQTWEDISVDFPSKVVNAVTISNGDPNIIYAGTAGDGVYRSNDGGQTWIYNTTGADNFSCYSLVINQDNSNEIFAGFLNMAVYRSLDAGASWELSANGICGMNLNDIAVNPVNPAQMLVAFEAQNCGGCYFTIDGGESWSLVESLPLTRYSAVAIDENGVLYAWSDGPSTVAQEGLYKSTDSGVSWTNMGPNIGPVFETQIYDVEISPENPDIILITGNNFGNNGWKGVVHKSSNGGESWNAVFVSENDYDSFKHANINGNTAYLAFHSQDASGGFYKSIDCGDNWIEINNGIPSDVKTANWITSDKTNSDIIFGLSGKIQTYFSVFKSIDGGSTWNDLNLHSVSWSAFTCLAIHPENNDVIYVGSHLASEPIYVTVTGGDSWKLASNNFPTTNVTSFSDMVQIGDNYYLYASTYSASAYGVEVQTPSYIQIEGFISDVTTSEPIPNAEIIFTGEMADYSFISNDQGEFEHNEFVAGTYTIECNAEGYNSYYAENVEIFEPTTINIQLTTPIIGADVSVINAVVSPDGYNTSELTISNTGTGLLEWHSIINFEQEYGDIVFQLNDLSAQTPENTSIFGIEFDGENLWVVCTGDVSGYNHFLCKFDINGNLLATYDQNIDSWGLRGIYYHEDGYLYGGSNKGFHRIDINDGSVTNLFDWKFGLSCIRGLTYIPYLEGFVARDYSTDFVIFDVEGNLLGTLQKPIGLSSSVSDIDYDPIHDCIWLYNRSGSANTCFHQYSISQEALTDVVIDIPLFSGLNSQRSGGSFFSSTLVPGKYVLAGATNQDDPFDVLFAVDICPSWIKTNPNYGFVQSNESMDVVVEYDGQGLIVGETHNCTLHLSSCHPDVGQIDIPVTLQVEQGVTVTQIFDLEIGYQFISSNVIPPVPDMMEVMAEIINDNLAFVRNSQGSTLRKIGPNWVNGIGNWIIDEGYLVKMNADDSFEIEGFRVDPATGIPVAIGYQFVSYFPENSMDALLAFGSIIGDDLDFIRNSQGGMLRKIGPNWVNGIGDAMQGEGYLVKMFAEGEIVYPAGEKSSGLRKIKPTHLIFEGGNAAEAVYTMYVNGLEIGDEVAAFKGNVILGSMTVNSENVFENDLAIFSELVNGQGYEVGEPIILKVWSNDNIAVADYEMKSLYNSYISDFYPSNDGEFSVVNIIKGTTFTRELVIYPNPATNTINISSPSQIDNVVIFNYVGQTVYEGNETKINVINYDSGIYIIRVETANGIETQKLTIE